MEWHAMPPEVNTSRLMAGAGPAPMVQAAAGWEAFAILLETQADELAASLAALASAWSGTASERAV
jgi:PPE-repeat protein